MTLTTSSMIDNKMLNKLCAYIAGKSLDNFYPSEDSERGRRDFSVLLDTMLNQISFADVFSSEGSPANKADLQRKVCQAVVDLKYPKGVPVNVVSMMPSPKSRSRLVDELVEKGISVLPSSRQVMRI